MEPQEITQAEAADLLASGFETGRYEPLGRLPVRYHRGALLLPSLPKPGRWLQDEQDWPGGAGRGLRDCEADFPLRL